MTTRNRQLDRDEVDARAAGWILRRENSDLAPQDRAAFEAWLAADSRHRAAYLELNQAWRFSAGLRAWRPVDAPTDPDLLLAQPASSRAVRRWPLAIAATALLALTASWLWFDGPETYSTRIGGYQRVVLDDGSVLQLNTDSKAQVHFSARRREVRLLRGEAYFEIARDSSRPFDVSAGSTVVRAVGTAFAVRVREPQRVEVLVTQGRVSLVASVDNGPRQDAQAGGATPLPLISAGETAETRPTGLRIGRVQNEEIERRLAWQTGRLNFQKEPLAVVVAEFNRYNRRRIEIADPALSALEVHGNFKASDLDSFVAAMRTTLAVRVEDTEDVIRLYAQ